MGNDILGSTFFSTAYIEECDTYNTASDGDLWASAWADDDNLYSANGDGKGFGSTFADIVVNRITGSPYSNNVAGTALTSNISQIWTSGGGYNRKPTGMISVDGNLYCAVQDLAPNFDNVPAATICKSTDHGATWIWDTSAPMFNNYVFTTIMFLDYGRNNVDCPDSYVYVYGIDYNWRDSFYNSTTDPTKLFLARVLKDQIMTRSSWQFYTGTDGNGSPAWSKNIASKQPVLQDDRRVYTNTNNSAMNPKDMTVISQGSIVYNKALNRYIYTSWTEYTFEFYEAPKPWGPWKRFLTKDYGAYPWTDLKNGGYSTTIPSKFISTDGKRMYVQSNTFMGGANNYCFSLRKLVVELYVSSTASNTKNNNNLALPANSQGVKPICKSNQFGKIAYMNDGILNHTEDSWDGEAKTTDWWGYTWKQSYNMNKVEYTTGNIFSDGGWFNDIKVQVRQNFNWMDVTGMIASPVYPNNNSAGRNVTYTFTFNNITGDGVRIIGTPGGTAHFTSIGELAVYYDGNTN